MSDLSNHVVGNVGLYFVCYKLSCLGWNVMPTARNARGIDIVIYNQNASRTVTLQVKALSKPSPVPLGSNVNKLFGDFFIICRNVATSTPECFILTPEEVKKRAYRSKGYSLSTGRRSHWLQPNEYATDEFREKWERIGKGVQDSMISATALPPRTD